MIVADTGTKTGRTLWVEAPWHSTLIKQRCFVDFRLAGESSGRKVHTTISRGVVESALQAKEPVMAAAMLDQYGWLSKKTCAEVARTIYEAHKHHLTPAAPPSGKPRTL